MKKEKQTRSHVVQRYVDILTNGGFKALFGDEAIFLKKWQISANVQKIHQDINIVRSKIN